LLFPQTHAANHFSGTFIMSLTVHVMLTVLHTTNCDQTGSVFAAARRAPVREYEFEQDEENHTSGKSALIFGRSRQSEMLVWSR